jgi:ribonuclease D
MRENDEAPASAALRRGKRMTNDEVTVTQENSDCHSGFVIPSSLDIRPSSLPGGLIAIASQLSNLMAQIDPVDRVAVDTEADSLHSYREKLCLLQISLPAESGRGGALRRPDAAAQRPYQTSREGGWIERSALDAKSGGFAASSSPSPAERPVHPRDFSPSARDYIIDPLSDVDLAPLARLLAEKEIVLHGADYDLRLLRRGFNLVAKRIFDTVIAARLIGIREFSLAALVERYFEVKLAKGSQKANWAQRPLPARMEEYARNDTHYLLALADRLGNELDRLERREWFRQSCRRAIEQAAVDRVRDVDEAWRISGAGALHGQAGAVLRALWNWREKEAEAADRPPFHILQNRELLSAAERFAGGGVPDYKHFSARRRRAFQEAGEQALSLPEEDWPVWRKGSRKRSSAAIGRRVEELRQHRERVAKRLDLEPSFIAARAALEAVAADETCAGVLLVPWQRQLLGI